ncbi:aquaporin-8-like [Mytilus californianus]|uniref:aquaporin-8-like n=1 Tax=Mytilus californianus TaxID=6549 RepID=UPI002246BC3D|nr:aquaporin-8-like [Mytilus californianus]
MSNRIQITNPGFDNADQERCAGNEVQIDIGNDISRQRSRNEDEPVISDHIVKGNLYQALFVEFLGTSIYVFIATIPYYDSSAPGMALIALIACFGKISGGHFNPAVTIGVSLCGRLSLQATILYPVVQIVGGLLGAALTRAVQPPRAYIDNEYFFENGITVLRKDVKPGWALLCEGLITFFLVLTYLMCTLEKQKTNWVLSSLAIGFIAQANIIAADFITRASMNPARSFGPAVCTSVFTKNVWKHHYVYWVGPMAGSAIAAFAWRCIHCQWSCCFRPK